MHLVGFIVRISRFRCTNLLMLQHLNIVTSSVGKGKGKTVPLQAWSGPEGSIEVKVPRLHDNDTGWW